MVIGRNLFFTATLCFFTKPKKSFESSASDWSHLVTTAVEENYGYCSYAIFRLMLEIITSTFMGPESLFFS